MRVDFVENKESKMYDIEIYGKFKNLLEVKSLATDIADSLLRKINDKRIKELLSFISERKDNLTLMNYITVYFSDDVFFKLGLLYMVFTPVWHEHSFRSYEVDDNIMNEYPMFLDEEHYKLAAYILKKANPFQIQLKGAVIMVAALYQLLEKYKYINKVVFMPRVSEAVN